MRRLALSLIFLWAVTACHRPPPPTARCLGLIELGARKPAVDAEAALKAGDRRLLSLGGYAAVAPGAETRKGDGRKFRMLKGTSDVETRACFDLRPAAKRYARLYNQAILARVGNGG